jgi:thiol:disulfide interchange protein DsbC
MCFLKKFTVLISTVFFASTACALNESLSDPEMLLSLKKMYPATTFREVNRTVVPGVFEVIMGQNIAYVERSGRYFFFGRLFDMQNQIDMTSMKQEEANRIDIASLPLADALKTVKGNGSRKLLVFSDPDCPYCKQLEKNLSGLTDVTIYTFLFPIEGLHPQAKDKAIAVWCSDDRIKAWDGLMVQGIMPSKKSCLHPVDKNIALAGRFGITGTPTLISGDGRRMPGSASAERITQWLDAVQGVSQ